VNSRQSEAIAKNTQMMAEMEQAARVDRQLMLDMSKITAADSRLIKVITIIAMVYLPLSLVTVRPTSSS